MADQRTFGSADKAPAEAGTQVRDKTQDVGAQVREKARKWVRRSATASRKLARRSVKSPGRGGASTR